MVAHGCIGSGAQGAGMNAETLLRFLEFDFEAGTALMKPRDASDFVHAKRAISWNNRYAWTQAFTVINSVGYLVGSITGTQVKAHRAIYTAYYGETPMIIDHIDGNRANNRITNLRSVASTDNARNVKLSAANKSGVKGVRAVGEAWEASISIDGGKRLFMRTSDKDEAAAWRAAQELRHGYLGH